MTESDFAEIVKTENQIKGRFHNAPKTYYIFSLAENIQNWSRKKFEKVDSYNKSSDVWFVYFDQKDIRKWVDIIEPIIKRITYEFEHTDY